MVAEVGADPLGDVERLDQQRLPVAVADAAHQPGALIGGELQRGGNHRVADRRQADLQHPPRGLDALGPHLLGEPEQPLQRVLDAGSGDVCSRPGAPVDHAAADEQLDGLAGRHPRQAEALCDGPLAGHAAAGRGLAGGDLLLQRVRDLPVTRDLRR